MIILINGNEPQEVVDKIDKVMEIKKIRILKIAGHWHHPPHVFKEIPDIKVGFERTNPEIDETDKKIIHVLSENPLASFVEMSEKTKLAPQTIKKRLDSLEKNKIILDYTFLPDIWLLGKHIVSVFLSCKGKENTDKLISHLIKIPQVSDIWECDHEWNLNFALWVDEQYEANKIISDIIKNFRILDIQVSIMAAMVGK